jgi:hypothetical protein
MEGNLAGRISKNYLNDRIWRSTDETSVTKNFSRTLDPFPWVPVYDVGFAILAATGVYRIFSWSREAERNSVLKSLR